MLPRRPTRLGLGAVREPATPLPSPEDRLDPREEPLDPHDEGPLADTIPSTPVAKAYVLPEDDERPADRPRPKSGVRIRPPLVAEEVVPVRRDARWEKD